MSVFEEYIAFKSILILLSLKLTATILPKASIFNHIMNVWSPGLQVEGNTGLVTTTRLAVRAIVVNGYCFIITWKKHQVRNSGFLFICKLIS